MTGLTSSAISLLLIGHAVSTVGQSSQPAQSRETLVGLVQRYEGKRVIGRELVTHDFSTGTSEALSHTPLPAAGDLLCVSLLDAHGKRLSLRREAGKTDEPAGYLRRVESDTDAPVQLFEQYDIRRMYPRTLSPNGRTMVLFDYENSRLALGTVNETHVIRTTWCISRPFSWSTDSSQVAFYYALSHLGDDVHVQKHGVALLSTDGHLRELVKASTAIGTPDSSCKDIPLGWGKSGRFAYYSEGLPLDDPRRERAGPGAEFTKIGTYRVNVVTGDTELLGPGAFCCVSPEEDFVLCYPCPKPTGDGSWVRAPARLDTTTGQITYLPREMAYPKISPSGELVACLFGGIRVFLTKDWSPWGQAVPLDVGIDVDDWGSRFRWITVEDEEAFRRQFATQPAP